MSNKRALAFGAAIGFFAGAVVSNWPVRHSETMVEGSLVSRGGLEAAWFERAVHATVARTYVLKLRSTSDPRWSSSGLFNSVDGDGPSGLPKLIWRDRSLHVEYRRARTFWFSNFFTPGNEPFSQVEIILVRLPDKG